MRLCKRNREGGGHKGGRALLHASQACSDVSPVMHENMVGHWGGRTDSGGTLEEDSDIETDAIATVLGAYRRTKSPNPISGDALYLDHPLKSLRPGAFEEALGGGSAEEELHSPLPTHPRRTAQNSAPPRHVACKTEWVV